MKPGLAARGFPLTALLIAGSAAAQPPMTGFYGGGFGVPGAFTYTQIELDEQAGVLAGRLYEPNGRAGSLPITDLRRDGPRLRFAARDLVFDLQRTATGYAGSVATPLGRRPAWFALRPGAAPPALLATVEGSYDLGGGRILSLSRNNDGGGFWYLELPSGRTGFLFNLSDREFIAGPCLYCAGPERLRLSFAPGPAGGRIGEVRVRLDGRDRTLRRLASYREEEVGFLSRDGTRLAGTLFLPAGPGRHPAVVLVHGSGAQTRNGFYGHIRFLAEAYARAGIAALAYDKRGTGGSEGDWGRTGFDGLADDAAAALRLLAARPDIRADRLGLSGASQAGWIVPMAASRYPGVRILQIRAGSAPMGVEESERRRLVRQMRADGYGEEEIARAMRIRVLMDNYARNGAQWQALAAAAEPVKDEFWLQRYIGALPAPGDADWAWLRQAFGFDVTADFAAYRGRVQILYGGSDALIDPAAPLALVRRALAPGVARQGDIAVLPHATHNGFEGRTGGEREFAGFSRFVPGYFERIVDWAAVQLR